MKTIWREDAHDYYRFYCPHCGVERRVALSPSPRPRHYAQIGLLTLVVMLVAWKWWEFKGVIVFLPLWITFESMYRLRARAQMACNQCGFDPYLFLADSDRAKEAIREFWKKKIPEAPAPLDGPPPQR